VIHRPRTALARRLLAACASVLLLMLTAVASLYLWPLDDAALRPRAEAMSFADASKRIAALAEAERVDPQIRPECRSVALVHPRARAKAVLMLHGYLGCPQRMAELAKRYYDQGYNVYVPLAPRHGRTDPDAHRTLTARELAAYAGSSMDITAALGAEAGVLGTSAGGVLATWLATTRPQQVQRTLVIAPFFRPAPDQAPPAAVRPMTVLYGYRILPDKTHSTGYSYAVLGQYLRLSMLLDTDTRLPRLRSVAVVTSEGDWFIDQDRAAQIPARIAETNRVPVRRYRIPSVLEIGHEAVDPARLGPSKDLLYNRYLALYEGRHPFPS
jgi:pimeloyl-ACP methyl ester carboxylesterase